MSEPTDGGRAAAEPAARAAHGPGGPGAATVAALVIALPVAVFALLAVQAWQHHVPSWDRTLSEAIHAYENEDTLLDRFDVLTIVLDPPVHALLLLSAVVVAGLCTRRRLRSALVVAAAVAGVTLLAPLLKEAVSGPPVDERGDGSSFPSGHSARTMAAAASLVWLTWATPRRWHVAVGAAMIVAATAVAVVYHEWHWTSDVLGGWSLAIAWVGCIWLALRLGRRTPSAA